MLRVALIGDSLGAQEGSVIRELANNDPDRDE